MDTVHVFMTITHEDGHKTPPGVYLVGDSISEDDAKTVTSNSRWGKLVKGTEPTKKPEPSKKSEKKSD